VKFIIMYFSLVFCYCISVVGTYSGNVFSVRSDSVSNDMPSSCLVIQLQLWYHTHIAEQYISTQKHHSNTQQSNGHGWNWDSTREQHIR